MPSITRSALVMFSAQQMYELVNDIDAYPQFLPGCVLTPYHHIRVELVDGPFKALNGGWTFTPLDDDACKVELELYFEFTSRLVEFAFGGIFKELANAMVHSFSERAKEVYGHEPYSG